MAEDIARQVTSIAVSTDGSVTKADQTMQRGRAFEDAARGVRALVERLARENKKPGIEPGFFVGVAYCTSTARLSEIFFCQIAGPVMCTDSPLASTATVTGMSFTSNS